MDKIIHFTPKDELAFDLNIKQFIDTYRALSIWNADEIYEQNIWDLGNQKGQNKRTRAIFSIYEAPAKCGEKGPFFPKQFLDFAKCILLYLQATKPVGNPAFRMAALRCIEAALRKLGKDSRPTAVNEAVLDEAKSILLSGGVQMSYAYRIAGQIQLIASSMHDKGIINLSRQWGHGLNKPEEHNSRISKEAIERREEKMPSEAALRALGTIFHEASEPSDIYVSSILAILLCTPERINEALRLQRNALIYGEGRFAGNVAFRWAGSKGFENAARWLPTIMIPVAKEAVENILKVTAPAREIAKWYLNNPGEAYYHEGASHLKNKEFLSSTEVALLLWGNAGTRTSANQWLTAAGVEKIYTAPKSVQFKRKDVEAAIIKLLPEQFPYLPGEDSLICTDSIVTIKLNEFHSNKVTYQCMFEYADYTKIDNRLGVEGKDSIFDRFNFSEDDGSRIEMNTHSLRHYLNHLARIGGMSELEIAAFSGRKDVGQNRAYDHMTTDEIQAPINAAIKSGATVKVDVALLAARNLVNRGDFKSLGKVNAHTTEYGFCVHNFAAEPCHMHRDCINCQEQVCIKGDSYKESNLRRLKDETEYLLGVAKESLTQEEYGADKWVEHQTKTLDRVVKILNILDNPNIANGALIKSNAKVIAPLGFSDRDGVNDFACLIRKEDGVIRFSIDSPQRHDISLSEASLNEGGLDSKKPVQLSFLLDEPSKSLLQRRGRKVKK